MIANLKEINKLASKISTKKLSEPIFAIEEEAEAYKMLMQIFAEETVAEETEEIKLLTTEGK